MRDSGAIRPVSRSVEDLQAVQAPRRRQPQQPEIPDVHNPELFDNHSGEDLLNEEFPGHSQFHSDDNMNDPEIQRGSISSVNKVGPDRKDKLKSSILQQLNTAAGSSHSTSPGLPPPHPITVSGLPVSKISVSSNLPLLKTDSMGMLTSQPVTRSAGSVGSTSNAALSTAVKVPSFVFSADQIDDFVRSHRQQIREITDCCKEETKVRAMFSMSCY